jgi:hypothetical protein
MEIEMLIKNMGVYFEQYKNTSDMLKGLVFLGNQIIFVEQNFAKNFLPFLKNIANFYTQLECQDFNYKTLALLA